MSLSIIIPSKNEQDVIIDTIESIKKSKISKINYEILVINDFSADNTLSILKNYRKSKRIKILNNKVSGLGGAINLGIKNSSKDYICIYMSDKSDSLNDMCRYYKLITSKNLDAVFGSRFIKGSKVKGYPLKKLFFNRIFNNLCMLFFLSSYNDYTNAFKMYKRKMLISFFPIVSENFNVFLELPLKTVSRNYNFKVIPISWNNRSKGKSKFVIKELTSKYFFTFLYCFLEKILLKKIK